MEQQNYQSYVQIFEAKYDKTQYLQIFSQHSIKKYSLHLVIVPLLINSCTCSRDIMFPGRVCCKCTGQDAPSVSGSACAHSLHFITSSLRHNKLHSLRVLPVTPYTCQSIYTSQWQWWTVNHQVSTEKQARRRRRRKKLRFSCTCESKCCHWSGLLLGSARSKWSFVKTDL